MNRHHASSPVLAGLLLAACGADATPSPVFIMSDAGSLTPVDAAREASVGPVDASLPPLPPPVPPPRQDCVAGAYSGKFDCSVDGLPIWGGDLAFDLLQSTEGGGEFTTLVVRPGTKIVGSDGYTGKFDGELAGSFDCVTGMFEGSLVRAVYLFPGANYPVGMMGDLAGSYAAGDPPTLVGTMGPLTSPEWGALAASATCTWQTERTGDVSSSPALDGGAAAEPTTCPDAFTCQMGGLGENVCRDATSQALPTCDGAQPRCTVGDRQGLCRTGLTGSGECVITCTP